MNSAPGILNYLAECYRENGSRLGVVSLASSRVRQSLIVEGEDAVVSRAVLDGQFFIPGKKASDLATQERLYEKECQLYYGSVFLVGPLEREEARAKPVFAPLILYAASVSSISAESGAEFSIETGQRILNYALLECLGDDSFIEQVERCIDVSTHTEGCVGELRCLLQDYFPDVSTDGLLNYPTLLKESELKSVLKQAETNRRGELRVVPAAAFFLADRSTGMRGVLNDLRAMAGAPAEFSYPVQAIFAKNADDLPSQRCAMGGEIPALLSEAQKKITDSARRNPLTLAVGPPGTGKSFTIAALAMEAMSRGESVLIVSKMDHAVDVVADKIEATLELPGVCVRAGRKSYHKDLKRFLEDLLSGILSGEAIPKATIKRSLAKIRKRRSDCVKFEGLLEKRGRNAVKRGVLTSRAEPGWFTRWRIARLREKVAGEESLHVLAGRISDLSSRQVDDTVEYLKLTRRAYLAKTLARNRKTFQAFSKGIRARSSHRQESYFKEVRWDKLLEALPVWLVNLSDLHRILPLERGLFDLVIIDEASQCDIASVMPALQRAKRAVITGDPKQLRHLSFLAGARQEEFALRFGLSEEDQEHYHFRNVSLVDLVMDRITDQSAIIFLNEHFRSRPGIIGFSNREFYAGRLAIMTGHREIDRQEGPPLSIFPIEGKRKANGVNEEEVDAIMAQIENLIAPGAPPLSIGILSPFRAQVDAILKRVEKMPGLTDILERHDLLVGTAHSFQGEERDVIFLSFALDDESPSASYRFMEKGDVFNVSITRARLANRLFVSFDRTRDPHSLVSRFLDYAETVERGDGSPAERVESRTEPSAVDLVKALEGLGIEVLAGFLIGGFEVDLLCQRNGRSLGIDLIGFPGPHVAPLGLDRHLMLQRAGIRLFPLSLLEWEVKRNELLAAITSCLGMEVSPS